MKTTDDNPYTTHERIVLLLPWYINKTLHGNELNAVERHLKICLTCKRELAGLRHLGVAIRQPGKFDSATPASFASLKNRLNAGEDAQARPAGHRWAKIAKFNRYRSVLALAATVAFALALPRFVPLEAHFANEYRTLSDGETAGKHAGTLRVIFKDNTSRETIQAILAAVHGIILEGPNEQALYTIAIKDATTTAGVLEKLSLLRKNEHVMFAEPAYALLSNARPENSK